MVLFCAKHLFYFLFYFNHFYLFPYMFRRFWENTTIFCDYFVF